VRQLPEITKAETGIVDSMEKYINSLPDDDNDDDEEAAQSKKSKSRSKAAAKGKSDKKRR